MKTTRDIVFKRCGCTDQHTGRQLARCPRLAEPGHGSWYYAVQVTTVGGRKARYRRGGFPTRDAAVAARQAVLYGSANEAAAGAWTVARWPRYWLAQAEPHLRPSTLHSYRDHVDRYLIPSIGRITLADPTGKRLQACFSLLARQRTTKGTLIAPATVDRVGATLRSALNAAVREGLIPATRWRRSGWTSRSGRTRSSGPTSGSKPGGATASAPRWRSGRCGSWSPSSLGWRTTGSRRCGG
jgi:Phage integrase, N-terminal SAM-like domain